MRNLLLASAILATATGFAVPVSAQGTIPGAVSGARTGSDVAGPVGGVVGGAVGAATGTVGGILGADLRPRFRTYVGSRHLPSYRYSERLRVGAVLPESGVSYYDVPDEYRVTKYKYTIVNDEPVLVDPTTRTVVEVIE